MIPLVWNSTNRWCECPNIDVLLNTTTQVKTEWDESVYMCRCPFPTGDIGLTLASSTPTYCQCPNPTLDPTKEVALVLDITNNDSCICPKRASITNASRQVNIVVSSGNDKCVCPSPSQSIDTTIQASLKLDTATFLCECPMSLLSDLTTQANLLLSADSTYCEYPTILAQAPLIWRSEDARCERPNI